MIARISLRFLAIFAVVIALLAAGAYAFMAREYAALLQPALGTPEGLAGYHAAMRRVACTIAAFAVPLLAVVGVASWRLAAASIAPLVAARERERAFAADAAHELRSPLATIAGVAQASRAGAPPELATALDTIAQAALDASAIVGDLLTLARAPDASLVACEPLDLGALSAAVAREFAPMAQARHVNVEIATSSVLVDGDERRLRQLLRNLLENAIRHASASVVIRSRQNGNRAELVVANDGDLIAPADRAKIFERFYRGNGHAGTAGLGLPIAAWIARSHGGAVSVRDGAGAIEFVVDLPVLQA